MIITVIREFKDVVFEDVVFDDNNSFVTLLSIVVPVTSMPNLLLSNTTSSNTTSLNSQSMIMCHVDHAIIHNIV